MQYRNLHFALLLILAWALSQSGAAQTATYHLHKEASTIATADDKLLTAGPDAASLAMTTTLTSKAAGEYLIKEFETQTGDPNTAGVIPSGSTLSFSLFMRKTANVGTVFPRAKIGLNSAAGPLLCTATGTTALNTTVTKQTISCTTTANIAMTATDRFYLWVGVNLTATSATAFNGELDVEGTLNGNFDSTIILPLGSPAPTITSLTPATGAVKTSVVIAGTNFRSAQGNSTLTFNGTTATPTAWTATSITAPVPTAATTGPVIVTVGGQPSVGSTFTVTAAPSITSLAPNTGAISSVVTITGTNFGPAQGNGTVKFGTTTATVTSWSATSIVVAVPTGAATGSVIVTAAGGVASNGVTFTVTAAPAITTVTPTAGAAFGASFTIAGSNFGATRGNGTVTLNSVPATVTTWSASSIVAQVPSGVTSGNVVVTASGGVASNAVRLKVLNTGGVAIDQEIFADGTATATTRATAAFTTASANELLLAFISSGRSTATNPVVNTVTGGSLTWVLVQRTNTQLGTAEIWRAFASTVLTNATVTATFSQSVLSSMTVVSFTGVDTTGTSGSGAIGAVATANAATGAPTASLTTTRANSVVFGVGEDPTAKTARTLGSNQSLVHQLLCGAAGQTCTLWVQQVPTLIPASGTAVTINDTAPTADAYNLSLVEVRPVATATAPVITSLAPTSGPIGTSVTIAGTGFGATQGTSTVTFGGISATATWGATSIVATVPNGVALGAVPVVVTVPGAGTSNSATFTVVSPLAVAPSISPLPNANNWNNTNVTVSYVCSGGVAPVQCPGPATIITEGANQLVTGTATDANGNHASASVTLNIDKTNPGITATVAPAPVNGVVTLPATVTFTCTDALSGVANCPAAINVTTLGANQTFNGTATDRAGNTATASGKFSVQQAALAITAAAAPTANANNWNNTNVTITYTCSGGVAPVQCPAAKIVTLEGANQVITASATDAAGQTASASTTLNIDKTAPTVTTSVAPLPSANGIVTGPAVITFICSDALSGVVACPAPITVSTAGAGQVFNGSVTDKAGNTASTSVTLSVQLTPLSVTASANPAANAAGWNNTNVSVSFVCAGGVPPLQCPAPQTVITEGANQLVSGTVTDAAGQTASASIHVSLDKTPPVITATAAPLANAAGFNNTPVTVTFVCSDAGSSGIAVCPSPITVSLDGTQTINGTATDVAGNSAIASVVVKLAQTPPTITASITPLPNAAGWNNTSPVTVSFVCVPGSVAVASCTGPQTFTTEGTQQVSGTVTDIAGFTASTSATVKIDVTPPTISGTVSPTPNGNGVNTTAPTVTFTCSDALSGIAVCPPPVSVTTTGSQTISGIAVDSAGNTSTASILVNYQNIPPLVIVPTIAPAPNSAGWNNTPVTVSFQCSGGLPPLSCPGPQTLTVDGANQLVTGTVVDLSGQTASVNTIINLDQAAPLVSITSPLDGSSFTTGSAAISGLSSDALSGIASISCNNSLASMVGTSFNCSIPLQPGTNVISVRATDVAGNISTASLSANLAGPKLVIISPAALDLLATNTVQVTGTVDDLNVSVVVNGVTATVADGAFTAKNVTLREGNNLITATGINAAGGVGSASVTVVLDTTPPTVRINSPADRDILTVPQTSVTGLVNDVVTGTVNSAQVSVTVNGVQAQVANRSFSAPGVLLVPGTNVITATATDRAGNINVSQVTVTFQDPANQQRIVMISGADQSGQIGTTLPQPLVVELMNALGQPISNAPVTFTVAKSDGQIQAFPQTGRLLSLVTDINGQASVNFQLGSRVGTGNNQVTVSSPGFVGQTVFNASALAGNPTQIHDISGGSQRGNTGQPLPEPFIVGVFDAGGNPVAGLPVVFQVEQGGGSLEGNPTVTRTTDSDGRAAVVLVLAQQEGMNNNVVSAAFTGLTGSPAFFTASGLTPSASSNTRISGIVLDNADQPIPNVTASVKDTNISALSDAKGQFTIANVPVGTVTLYIDGSTSTRPETFPFLEFPLVAVAGQNNSLSGPIYLPALDMDNSKVVGGDEDVVITMKGAPGVAYTVFAHSAIFPDGSTVGRMTLSQVHGDKVPMAPPNGTSPALVGTLQPARVKFNPPVRIQVPNTSGLAAGQVVEVYSFDHDLEQFVSGGTARVSDDASVIVSDPGFGLRVSGWHAAPPPPPPPTCTSSCDDHDACTQDSCQNGVCQNKPLNVTLKITAPPDNPNPDDNNFGSNFSFLSDTQITGTASLTGGGDPNDIQWTVTGIRGGIKDPNPANRKGPSFTFTPDPPAHPAYCPRCAGGNGRSPALGFTLRVEVCSKNDQHVIKQDTRDIIRQEYKNHTITIPGRGDFTNSQATAHFDAGTINRTAYAPLILGNPGAVAESIRAQYNVLLNGDQQVAAPGAQHLAPTAIVVQASGTSFAVIGRKLITPPCWPAAAGSCDDTLSADGLSILAGADGIAQTTALRGDFGLVLNSTWRNPERNEAAGGVVNSRHQFGNAVDMSPSNASVGRLTVQPGLYCVLKTAASAVTNFAQAENGPAHAVPCNQGAVNHIHGQNN
jgi:hypothetical protein